MAGSEIVGVSKKTNTNDSSHTYRMGVAWKLAVFGLGILTAASATMFIIMLCQAGKENAAAAFAQATAVPAALIAIIFQFHELRYQRLELEELAAANRDQADQLRRSADFQEKLAEAQEDVLKAQKQSSDALAKTERMQATRLHVDLWLSRRREVEEVRAALFEFIQDAKRRAAHNPKLHDPLRLQISELDHVIDSIDGLISLYTNDDPEMDYREAEGIEEAAIKGMNNAREARKMLSKAA